MAAPFKACAVDGCNRDSKAPGSGLGWCPKHYLRFRRNGDPLVSKYNRDQSGQACSVDGCDRLAKAKSFCPNHYLRWKKYGDPLSVSDQYRRNQRWLEKHVDHEGEGCLIWPFSVGDNGRGMATIDGARMSAPRAMCLMAHGQPPSPEYETAHSCGKGHEGCVHPLHLSWKTHADNESDKLVHGTMVRGELVNTAKLTEADVIFIRKAETTHSRDDLAAQFDVARCTIWEIQTRRSWAWLT